MQGVEQRRQEKARQRFDRDYRIFLEMHAQRKVLDSMQ